MAVKTLNSEVNQRLMVCRPAAFRSLSAGNSYVVGVRPMQPDPVLCCRDRCCRVVTLDGKDLKPFLGEFGSPGRLAIVGIRQFSR